MLPAAVLSVKREEHEMERIAGYHFSTAFTGNRGVWMEFSKQNARVKTV